MKKSKAEIERDIARFLAQGDQPRRSEVDREEGQTEAGYGGGGLAPSASVRFKPRFKPCSQRRFDDQLEILPPIAWTSKGFLVGEPWSHRECHVTGRYLPAYQAMVKRGERYFESCEGLTVPEWRALDPVTLQIA
jgi:hypothetical protein